jgi:two-component system, LuxR family, response regulator FixJ
MNKRCVYVVDDEEPIRRSLRMMLGVEGYAVTLFDSGVSLLNALEGLGPGSLLLDLRMPGKDGLEVQQEITARRGTMPTIVMTGHGDLSVAIAALGNGAVAFLEKPFSRAAAVSALETAFLLLEQPEAYQRRRQSAWRAVADPAEEERSFLQLLAAGGSYEAIAAELATNVSELDQLRSRVVTKLAVSDIRDAIAIAIGADLGRHA